MSRTPRPVLTDRAREAVIVLIARTALEGNPCPTASDFTIVTGVPRRRMMEFLLAIQSDGLIEIEVADPDPCRAMMPRRYRMRVLAGRWTDWTSRPGRPSRKEQLRLDAAGEV